MACLDIIFIFCRPIAKSKITLESFCREVNPLVPGISKLFSPLMSIPTVITAGMLMRVEAKNGHRVLKGGSGFNTTSTTGYLDPCHGAKFVALQD